MKLSVEGQEATLHHLRVRLRDGRIGWYQRSTTDCLQAALATLMQLPYEECEVSTLRELKAWADRRDLRVQMHFDEPPLGRWIGLEATGKDGYRHTVVGQGNEVHFDPASGWEFAGGRRPPPIGPLAYVVSLESAC